MGRADVLLRFLQKVRKDTPEAIERYLNDVDAQSEQRPLADQIVDRIIAGDKALYKHYAEARREVGTRNPYGSPEDDLRDTEWERALGSFMSKWIDLETVLRKLSASRTGAGYQYKLWSDMLRSTMLKPETKQELEHIRLLRNQAVHGIEVPNPEQLLEARKTLQQALTELEKPSTMKRTAKHRSPRKRTSRRRDV